MLAKRIIPCLDVDRGRVVKGTNFLNLRDAGDPVEVAKRYEDDGADELVFLDITASHEDRNIMADLVRRVAEQVFMPFCVGGGIRTLEDATRLIHAGAEKVSLNTSAVSNPELITAISNKFGANACVVNIDPRRVFHPLPPFSQALDELREAKGRKKLQYPVRSRKLEGFLNQALQILKAGRVSSTDGLASEETNKGIQKGRAGQQPEEETIWYEVHTHGGRNPTGLEAIAWAKEVERRGAGEIVLTSMDQDGTKAGYNIELTRMVAEAVNIPVVASGGAGNPEHLYQVLTEGKADAALAASIFHYGEYPVPVVKKYLAERGVIVRR